MYKCAEERGLNWIFLAIWGELNPATRSLPGGKAYKRKKEKQRTGKEFRNGFDAGELKTVFLEAKNNFE